MSDPRFFRKYLEILSEAPPVAPTTTKPATLPATPAPAADANPTPWQQAKAAVGQQYDTYKQIGAGVDAAAKQGSITQQDAQAAKSQVAGAMVRGGIEAGKAAMQGRDPSAAYAGSMIKSTGDTIANSGISTKDVNDSLATANQYRGPNAQDITKHPEYAKLPPAKQKEVLAAQQQLQSYSDDDLAQMQNFDFQKAGKQVQDTGQQMIDQNWKSTGPAAGFVPSANAALGLPTDRAATDAEMDAVANEDLDRIKKFIRK